MIYFFRMAGRSFLFCLLAAFSFTLSKAWAAGNGVPPINQNLRFDYGPGLLNGLHFDHDNELKPKANDFKILEKAFMSNARGERWAVLTLKNSSSGQRLLKNENIVARFADGSQAYAKNLDEVLSGKQKISMAIFFGMHKFPIIALELD